MLRIISLLLCLMFIVVSVSVRAGEPTVQLKTDIERILEILSNKELKNPENIKKRRELISQIIRNRFDFEEMSKRSLAIHWARRSPEERRKFIPLFSELLERAYIKKIEEYTDEKVIYMGESVEDRYAVVKTKIITEKNTEIPIDYRIMHKNSDWLVYDIVIEGVSLVNNYRTQFNKIIRSQSYEMLVKRIQRKLEKERASE